MQVDEGQGESKNRRMPCGDFTTDKEPTKLASDWQDKKLKCMTCELFRGLFNMPVT